MNRVPVFGGSRQLQDAFSSLRRRRPLVAALFLAGIALGLVGCGVPFVMGSAKVKLRGHQIVSGFSDGRAIIKRSANFRLGYIDSRGVIVIPVQFRSAGSFSEGLAPVEMDYREGFAFIDVNGKVVIEPQFDSALPFSEGLAAVQRDGKWGYIDKTGSVRIPFLYDDAFAFSEGRARIIAGGFAGFIDTAGEVVLEPRFYRAGSFSEGMAFVCERSLCGYADRSGNVVIPFQFEDAGPFQNGLAPIRKGDKWGYIDRMGRAAIDLAFDEAAPFSEGLARVGVIKDSSFDSTFGGYTGRATFFGFIDTSGKRVFDSSILGTEPFKEGITAVRVPAGGLCSDCYQYRLMTKKGAFLPGLFDRAGSFTHGRAIVTAGNTSYVIDHKGSPLIEFDNSYFDDHPSAARNRTTLRYGYIDTAGKTRIPNTYIEAQPFSEGLALVEETVDRSGRRQSFMNQKGQTIFTLPGSISQALPFSGGLSLISASTERTSKYGYMDTSGRVVIPPSFASATPFFEGLAAVKRSRDLSANDWGYIDTRGQFAIPPKFKGAGPFSNGLAFVEWISSERYLLSGVIDRTGKIVIDKSFLPDLSHSMFGVPSLEQFKRFKRVSFGERLIPKFDAGTSGWTDPSNRVVIPGSRFAFMGLFSEGRAPVQMREGLNKGAWGYIDARGSLVIEPRHARAEPFSNGLAAVKDGAGRYGYVTAGGAFAVAPMWVEEAHPFHDGRALVKLNGRFGYIDKTGRFAIPPQFPRAESFSDGLAATAIAVAKPRNRKRP